MLDPYNNRRRKKSEIVSAQNRLISYLSTFLRLYICKYFLLIEQI